MSDNTSTASPAAEISSPTLNPVSVSSAPTVLPQAQVSANDTATAAPSVSAVPTINPTRSHEPTTPLPTVSPTPQPTGAPTAPTQQPTGAPTGAPTSTSAPSLSEKLVFQAFKTQLFVNEQRKFTDLEKFTFEGILESHTGKIGLNLTKPWIKTTSEVLRQDLGTVSNETIILQVTYLMNWTTIHGYDIKNYPNYFQDYMNTHAIGINEAIDKGFEIFPEEDGFVTEVGNTAKEDLSKVVTTDDPSPAPTNAPVMATPAPSNMPSLVVTSEVPSIMPSTPAPVPVPVVDKSDVTSAYVIGIIIAFVVVAIATFIAVFIRWYLRKQNRLKEEGNENAGEQNDVRESPAKNATTIAAAQDQFSGGMPSFGDKSESRGDDNVSDHNGKMNASVAIPIGTQDAATEANTIAISEETAKMPQQHTNNMGSSAQQEVENSASTHNGEIFASTMAQTGLYYGTVDSMISLGQNGGNKETGHQHTPVRESLTTRPSVGTFVGTNLIAQRSASFSSESMDGTLSSQTDILVGDEFDKYRDQVLEKLRTEVESKIDGVEGMMSMAITQIMLDAGKPLDLAGVGGQDLGSIEASSLCETFEWQRQSQDAAGRTFFEQMLNKIASTVHHGLVRPQDGARILHGCASMIGMSLLQELPKTTLIVYSGLVKTNDLAKGHEMLVETFAPFGDIVDASIAPQNRGFGFVRFVQSKSVEAVLTKHRESEIEIQDVAVSIKTL